MNVFEVLKPGQSLPKQIKVTKMPTPPQAPTGPDGTDENGTRIGTTPKGNRSVANGAGTYIFTPTYDMSGKLISGDNTSIKSGNMGVSVDKDKGATVDYKLSPGVNISANSKTGIKVSK